MNELTHNFAVLMSELAGIDVEVAAIARNRHSHGAGRAAARRYTAHFGSGSRSGGHRLWSARGVWLNASDGQLALRH
jgi:hypothetical protein